jgi:cell division inhibitor SepF
MGAGFMQTLQGIFGLDTEEEVYGEDDDFEREQPKQGAHAKGVQPAQVNPSPTPVAAPRSNIVGLPTSAGHEVVVIEPRSFDEALAILDNLRSRKAVILNLMGLAPEQSQRLVDFVSGACHALDGHQDKIGESIFLFTPSNVVINTFHSERDWMGSPQPKDLFWRVR